MSFFCIPFTDSGKLLSYVEALRTVLNVPNEQHDSGVYACEPFLYMYIRP